MKKQNLPLWARTGHKKPVTRREFLQAGLIEFGAVLMAPSVLSVISESAFGADLVCPQPPGPLDRVPAFIHVNLSGGAGMSAMAMILDKNNQPLTTYNKVGLGVTSGLTIVNRFGNVPFPGNGVSKFLTGIETRATTPTLDKTAFVSMVHRSNDDTSENPMSALGMLSKAGAKGLYLPLMGTQSGRVTGVNQKPALLTPPVPLIVRSFNDVDGAVNVRGTLTTLSTAQRQSLFSLVSRLTQRQVAGIEARTGGATVSNLVQCATNKNLELVANPVNTIDPRTSAIAGVWGLTAASSVSAQSTVFASLVLNVMNGNSGAASMELGGYDYHDNTRTTGDGRDLQAGELIGRILESSAILGSPVFIHVTSDGAVSSNISDASNSPWVSDRGISGASFMIAYHPSGRPVTNKTQVGYFNTDQASDDKFLIGNSPQLATAAVFANYCSFAKRNDLIGKVIPGAFSAGQIPTVVAFPS